MTAKIDSKLDKMQQMSVSDAGAELRVEHVATANLPTQFGEFKIWAFRNNRDNKEHVAVVAGDPTNREDVLTRVHSECLTGDVFTSMKCDCGEQIGRASCRERV